VITDLLSRKVSDPLPVQTDADGTVLLEELLVTPRHPRHLSWLLLRDHIGLNEQEQRMSAFIFQECTIEITPDLAQRFVTVVRYLQ
jgi:hypothetical protein